MKNIAILGSTGSIGTQALEVISSCREKYKISLLTTNNNIELLIKQAKEFLPEAVVINNETNYDKLKEALKKYPIQVHAGDTAIVDLVQMDSIDTVLTAMVGFPGLMPTISAMMAKKNIALANKETMVVAGELIAGLAERKSVEIYPVDSEHSAIFQCMAGEYNNPIEKIILTGSGGPFRTFDDNALKNVTKKQALEHPNWNMGQKITIDSATLMNKGLEVIEAKWLFNLDPEQIEVIIHPQSVIHSMVQFEDGSIKAQLGNPDMKMPISYALSYPERNKTNFERFSFNNYPNLSFEQPDFKKFSCLGFAFEALKKGGNIPCALNAANEVAVENFLNEKISFLKIPEIIEHTMNKISYVSHPNLYDYIDTNKVAREIAESII